VDVVAEVVAAPVVATQVANSPRFSGEPI
jgi:hypothetical protein